MVDSLQFREKDRKSFECPGFGLFFPGGSRVFTAENRSFQEPSIGAENTTENGADVASGESQSDFVKVEMDREHRAET
jgi:hypothetical protein